MPVLLPSEFSGAVPVDGYGPGFFRVAGQVHEGAVIVTASGARPWAGLDDIAALLALASEIDVLFLGMGGDIAAEPAAMASALEATTSVRHLFTANAAMAPARIRMMAI